MPEDEFRHIRVRSPDRFSKFRVISRMGNLDPDDQSLVRRHVRKPKRPACKYTVGKLKGRKKIKGRSWKLQKIMVPKGGNPVKKKGKKKKKRKNPKKKWGKIGSPKSEKRKRHLKKIRPK